MALSTPISILHLSDLHFLAGDRRKARFLGSLGRPDVTVLTGDLIGEPEGVEEAVAALRPLRGRLASYVVLGSNDYFVAEPLNYLNYFTGKRKRRPGVRSRWREMVAQLEEDGWTLRADGVGDIRSAPADLPYRRVDLLTGLFPSISVEGERATIRSATAPS